MFKTKPIPVRLPEWIITKLDSAASKLGYTRAGLMRYCIETWVGHYDKHGTAALPVEWDKVIREFDGRTIESRKYSEEIAERHAKPKKAKAAKPAAGKKAKKR